MVLEEKVALVTGAASGIGRAVAMLYAREGARVVVSDLDPEGGEDTVRRVREAGGDAHFVKTDVSDPDACARLVEESVTTYGRLDAACNNAGIGGEQNPTAEYGVEDWQRVIAINLSSVFYCMKAQIPAMLKGGSGSIVNMASILGQVGFAGSPAYSAAKHGVVGLTKTAALDHSAQGVRINAVGPGFIRTPMIERLEQDADTQRLLVERHPIGRLGEPQEVAELVVWLSSDKSAFVTGAYLPVDGAYLAQ